MTPEQIELLNEFFSRYGSPSKEGERRFNVWLVRADAIDTPERVTHYDQSALSAIADCRRLIETLEAYRLSLAERYSYLATAPTVPVLRLRRERRGYPTGKVYHFLEELRRNLDDGSEVLISCTRYAGTERSKALAAYAAYQKAHPGIVAEKAIEKARWER